jgi:Lysine methyltransferase
MFTFNFLTEDATEESTLDIGAETATATGDAKVAAVISHPFVWKQDLESLLDKHAQKEFVYQDIELSPDVDKEEDDTEDNCHEKIRRVCMEQYEKEVIPGVYEGGLQVWEGSLDLVRYFQENNICLQEGFSAMELGCGHALPGCWLLREALRKHHSILTSPPSKPPFTMVFVDYNEYVIDDVTLSNIVLNTGSVLNGDAKQLAQHQLVQVGSGDWKDMSEQLQERRFDFIVAAETTYTTQAALDTAELLQKHLALNTGIGWISSKRYYFGTGGGTDALREAAQALNKEDNTASFLEVETASVIDSGVGNIREILKVTCHARCQGRLTVQNGYTPQAVQQSSSPCYRILK